MSSSSRSDGEEEMGEGWVVEAIHSPMGTQTMTGTIRVTMKSSTRCVGPVSGGSGRAIGVPPQPLGDGLSGGGRASGSRANGGGVAVAATSRKLPAMGTQTMTGTIRVTM